MITQLEIKDFRGFSEYKIEDVGQVNLLVGTNNCGKTSILEAIRLFRSKGNAYKFYTVLICRGEQIQNKVQEEQQLPEVDLSRLFYGFQLKSAAVFSISGIHNSHSKGVSASIKEIDTHSDLFDKLPDFIGNYQLDVRWESENGQTEQVFPISQTGGLSYNYIRRIHGTPGRSDADGLKFVSTASLSPQEVISLFDKIVLSPDEELVIEGLKIIEPDIIRIASLGGAYRHTALSSGEYVRGGIIIKSSKWEQPIPIGNFGDGIWRLLGLILSLVAAKNGTLLIDEIDTGLHHTVMSKMWKLICITARKLNVQVFATTHSSDCWKTLADNAVEDEFADMPIRIHRINKNKESAVTFTNREMHLALDREIEVR